MLVHSWESKFEFYFSDKWQIDNWVGVVIMSITIEQGQIESSQKFEWLGE